MPEAGSIFDKEFPDLLPQHVAQLRASGIGDAVIRERGYESILGPSRLREVGFAEYQIRKPGLLLPVWAPDGSNGLFQFRPDFPREDKAGKVFKYETPARAGLRLDVPRRCRPMLGDPSIPLYITEGIKKGDAAATHGLCVVTVIGVYGFRGRNDLGGIVWLADWQTIALNERVIIIAYDSDVMTKAKVREALDMLTQMLHRKGATVRHAYLPGGPKGEKVGLDDFLLVHSVEEIERYTMTPTLRPDPKPTPLYQKLSPGDERHLSDTGNAYRLVSLHGPGLRYCHPWNKWLTFNAQRWEIDQRGRVMTWAKETVRAIYKEAAAASDADQAKAIAEFAMQSESASKMVAMIRLTQDELPLLPDELDRDVWVINFPNGTLDLRTGQLHPHSREELITKLAPVAYDPAAQCPQWLAFLEQIMPDAEVRDFLQNAVGYCLTGDVSEQVLFLLHGAGANGKSTFLNVILALLGDYGKPGAPGLLLAKSGESHPTEVADLFGVRFVSTVEIAEGRSMAESLVKQITGGDPIKARRMREDFWTFMPTHKVWLAANHKPVVRGTDEGIWRRVRLIPFDVIIPYAKQDKKLTDKLRAELPGILAWAVRGCLNWQREGLGYPSAVLVATERYRKEMDLLAAFLLDCCVVGPNFRAAKGLLYIEYKKWCEANGEKFETQRALSGRMSERGFGEMKGTGGLRLWLGVGLASEKPESGATSEGNGPKNAESGASGRSDPISPMGPLPGKNQPQATPLAPLAPLGDSSGSEGDDDAF